MRATRMSAKTVTEQIFQRVAEGDSSTGAGGSSSYQGLLAMDRSWQQLKQGGWSKPVPAIVFPKDNEAFLSSPSTPNYDIAVVGGTLGIFYALALQKRGYRVAVIERGLIRGRTQEWNISRKELQTLQRLQILTGEEIDAIIGIEFNPVRVGFHTDTSSVDEKSGVARGNGFEMNVTDILNLGIKPHRLIEIVKNKFVVQEGTVFEQSLLQNITIYQDTAHLQFQETGSDGGPSTSKSITARLVIDATGNGSPIVRQIRGSVEPDGICIVVGSCSRGFDAANNTYSDVIYTDTPITTNDQLASSSSISLSSVPSSKLQYFWEAFPAGSGSTDRTTYLFTYLDAKPERPSLLSIFEDYWTLLPRYQGKSIDDLQFLRLLYGVFPTYRNSPVQSPFARILQVGDASGIQSPLSFGGFGSLTRHLERIVTALDEALKLELLSADDLNCINSYQPNLSACWMFQRAMSVRVGYQPSSRTAITDTLSNSFSAMNRLGEETFRPFLQDVLQFVPLLKTLSLAFAQDLLTPVKILPHVGLVAMLDFLKHFFNLGLYTALSHMLGGLLLELTKGQIDGKSKYYLKRLYETLKFGSGLDYYDHEG